MTRTLGRLACALLVALPLSSAAPALAGGPGPLAATDIHPAGWMSSSASDVNNRGQVILTATNTIDAEIQPPRAFVWQAGRHTELRPLPGGNGSLARDINERGEAVGFCQSEAIAARPCLWRGGRPVDLGTLDERGTGTALAVNDRGEVVGDNQTFIPGAWTRAFIWRRGVLTDLGGAGERSATGINNRSQVIGVHYTESGQQRGFLWQRGVLTELGTLGGAESVPADINERGQIVGTSSTAEGTTHAFLWQNGRMIDLGTPGTNSGALAINDRGEVTGWWNTPAGQSGGFHWHRGVRTEIAGYVHDINERGWAGGAAGNPRRAFVWRDGRTVSGDPATAVFALNDRGMLAGWNNRPDGNNHATVWR